SPSWNNVLPHYHIREAELQMDTIIFCSKPPESESTTSPASVAAPVDSTSPLAHDVNAPDRAAVIPDIPPLNSNTNPTWGAKPRSLAISTPQEPASWSQVAPRSRRGKQPPHSFHHTTQLDNRFDILALQDFPPLPAEPQASPPPSPQFDNAPSFSPPLGALLSPELATSPSCTSHRLRSILLSHPPPAPLHPL
ncbi:hypothetical protein ABVT39_017567, partial [Epinephelus coioides]